jgi:hypothetical protein
MGCAFHKGCISKQRRKMDYSTIVLAFGNKIKSNLLPLKKHQPQKIHLPD